MTEYDNLNGRIVNYNIRQGLALVKLDNGSYGILHCGAYMGYDLPEEKDFILCSVEQEPMKLDEWFLSASAFIDEHETTECFLKSFPKELYKIVVGRKGNK